MVGEFGGSFLLLQPTLLFSSLLSAPVTAAAWLIGIQRYLDVLAAADMVDQSPVRGCMVIKPWGMAIWDTLRAELDRRIRAAGVSNAYFPIFIPLHFLAKEAEHVDGFAKECAVVTHHRLTQTSDGNLVPDPAAKLEVNDPATFLPIPVNPLPSTRM